MNEHNIPSFADRLADLTIQRRTPALVGLDPRAELLPEALQPDSNDPADIARSYTQFCHAIIDVVCDRVPAVKPQSAFFERLGKAGMLALDSVIQHARAKGLLVILDGKRNDIGSTAVAYAEAYLGDTSPWQCDALTVSPYLGEDSLEPFVEVASRTGGGIFVLVKTSNAGGGMLQDVSSEGLTVYQRVANYVERISCETVGKLGYGAAGAVVGATYPAQLAELRARMPHAWILVPGFGAQGGTAADVASAFDAYGLGALVNSSRGIIFAHRREPWKESFGEARWEEAVSAALDAMIAELAAETPAGLLR